VFRCLCVHILKIAGREIFLCVKNLGETKLLGVLYCFVIPVNKYAHEN
jgi:hypothetical protein